MLSFDRTSDDNIHSRRTFGKLSRETYSEALVEQMIADNNEVLDRTNSTSPFNDTVDEYPDSSS